MLKLGRAASFLASAGLIFVFVKYDYVLKSIYHVRLFMYYIETNPILVATKFLTVHDSARSPQISRFLVGVEKVQF